MTAGPEWQCTVTLRGGHVVTLERYMQGDWQVLDHSPRARVVLDAAILVEISLGHAGVALVSVTDRELDLTETCWGEWVSLHAVAGGHPPRPRCALWLVARGWIDYDAIADRWLLTYEGAAAIRADQAVDAQLPELSQLELQTVRRLGTAAWDAAAREAVALVVHYANGRHPRDAWAQAATVARCEPTDLAHAIAADTLASRML